MKFILFVLIIGVSCSLATDPNNSLPPALSPAHDLMFNGGTYETGVMPYKDRASRFPILSSIFQRILGSKKGIMCNKREVNRIHAATSRFLFDMQKCGNSPLFLIAKAIMEKASIILRIIASFLNFGNASPELYYRNMDLTDDIEEGANALESPVASETCSRNFIREMKKTLRSFPYAIANCAE